jgi:RNA 2',3'-cyclic 3'-phosphodiesterase
MRAFLAINLAGDLRSQIFRDAEPLRRVAPEVTWVRSELLHFTVKFLGDVGADQVDTIRTRLRAVACTHHSFVLQLSGTGSFPNFRRPRVVWIGVKPHRTVFALAEDVEEACELLGFERDARGFSPHLTLGRVRRELDRATAVALERAALAATTSYVVSVESLDLMRSDLGPKGPSYAVVEAMPLAAQIE